MWNTLKRLDAYPKLLEEVRVRTLSGGIVSLTALLLMVVLFFSEMSIFLSTETIDHLVVDTSDSDKLRINVDISFPAVPCSLLSIDVVDVSGSSQEDIDHHILKTRLDPDGKSLGAASKEELGGTIKESDVLAATANEEDKAVASKKDTCGSCYGAQAKESDCCNTCDDVKEAYRLKGWALSSFDHIRQCKDQVDRVKRLIQSHEGCQVSGYLEVAKCGGNFHIAPGQTFTDHHSHSHDFEAFEAGLFNVTHTIEHLSFGELYPGIVNPLDKSAKSVDQGGAVFQYYIKVVPTTYEYLDPRKDKIVTNQYSATEHTSAVKDKQGLGLPGVFFYFDISPVKVEFKQVRHSFFHFITQLCAIVGGVYTVAGLVDKFLYQSMRHIEKKNMGKFG